MKFFDFSQYLQKLESTASRNQMTEILAELFKQAKVDEVDKICYLSLGRLVPKFTGIEFNLAEKMMIKVLSQAYDKSEEEVKKKYKTVGDLGDVAERLSTAAEVAHENLRGPLLTREKSQGGHNFSGVRSKATSANFVVSPPPLFVLDVYQKLMEIAQESGEGSVKRKIKKMAELLANLDSLSAKYVARIPVGKLRLGFSDMTILDALSWMVTGDKLRREEIEQTYNVRADVGQIVKIVKKRGLRGLRRIKISLGTPIMPALCQRLATVEEMIEKIGKPYFAKAARSKVAVEPKYDGTRLQVHFSKKRKWEEMEEQLFFDFKPEGFIRTFTRNLESTTHMFPDLIEAIFQEVKAQEAILDGEAIGFDRQTGKFLPFQETIKRKRKHGVGKKAKEIPLRFFCFDILYKDGHDLLKTPFNKRREILEKIISSKNKTIILSPQIVTDDPKVLRKYHDEQIKNGLEGAVVKKWQAPYEPGRRGFTWVKFKQEKGKKGGGLTDTLDCVVMGYYKGRGRRAGFGIGAFLVGIKKAGLFLTISKIGTGLSDEQWRELRVQGSRFKVRGKPKEYGIDKNLVPDVWCRPAIVVEIEADNITKSPIHTAGYALRFPRLVRFREDKDPDQATTLEETKRLYNLSCRKPPT